MFINRKKVRDKKVEKGAEYLRKKVGKREWKTEKRKKERKKGKRKRDRKTNKLKTERPI